MSLTLLLKINRFIQRIENIVPQIFGRGFPPGINYFKFMALFDLNVQFTVLQHLYKT